MWSCRFSWRPLAPLFLKRREWGNVRRRGCASPVGDKEPSADTGDVDKLHGSWVAGWLGVLEREQHSALIYESRKEKKRGDVMTLSLFFVLDVSCVSYRNFDYYIFQLNFERWRNVLIHVVFGCFGTSSWFIWRALRFFLNFSLFSNFGLGIWWMELGHCVLGGHENWADTKKLARHTRWMTAEC